jgi:hypothetical protein
MNWLRLYITVEGQAEKAFADQALTPHLANFNIEVKPRVVLTNRKLGKRGGILDFAKIEGDLIRLMHQDRHPEARFTTMIDFYALPPEFPGWAEARTKALPKDRVAVLEHSLHHRFGDDRFHPYIQLHEFEALLYCDLSELQCRLNNAEHGIAALQREVRNLAPEDINEGARTAPSKRIIKHLPVYERSKVRVGAPAAAAIGLPALRTKCPHFNEWLTRLESLSSRPL